MPGLHLPATSAMQKYAGTDTDLGDKGPHVQGPDVLTPRLVAGGKLLGIIVVDYIIIGG